MSATSTAPVTLGRSSPTEGMGWRVAVSIVSVFGLASFVLLYFAFWATTFSWLQNLAVVVVATLVFIGVNGASWASWGMRHARAWGS